MLKIIVLAAVALLTANCATVTRGTTSQIQVQSEPTGADVATSFGHRCVTPCTLTVDRKAEFTVSVAKPGYRQVDTPVRMRLAGAGAAGFAGNILLGGVVGMVADAATGATLEHDPNPVSVTLSPIAPPPRQRQRGRAPVAAPPPSGELPPIPAAPEPLATQPMPETS